jgi:hypothetical protein
MTEQRNQGRVWVDDSIRCETSMDVDIAEYSEAIPVPEFTAATYRCDTMMAEVHVTCECRFKI